MNTFAEIETAVPDPNAADLDLLCELTPAIRQRTVRLRREHRMKLPEAIICATATEYDAELWTNGQRLLTVPGRWQSFPWTLCKLLAARPPVAFRPERCDSTA